MNWSKKNVNVYTCRYQSYWTQYSTAISANLGSAIWISYDISISIHKMVCSEVRACLEGRYSIEDRHYFQVSTTDRLMACWNIDPERPRPNRCLCLATFTTRPRYPVRSLLFANLASSSCRSWCQY